MLSRSVAVHTGGAMLDGDDSGTWRDILIESGPASGRIRPGLRYAYFPSTSCTLAAN